MQSSQTPKMSNTEEKQNGPDAVDDDDEPDDWYDVSGPPSMSGAELTSTGTREFSAQGAQVRIASRFVGVMGRRC